MLELQSVRRAADQAGGTQALTAAVGVRGPMPGAAGAEESRRWSAGRMNAAVLPLPVCDETSRSLPASTAGIARRWTSVGSA